MAYPHYDTYTWSMLSSNRAVEDGSPGWTSGPIAQLRFDPNEDPGARRWSIDEVAVRADDQSSGRFDVQWRDTTPTVLDVAPTVVSIGVDSDRAGFDGTIVADSITMTEGVNTTEVDTCGLAPGSYWVYLTAERGPATVAEYASGPLQGHQRRLLSRIAAPGTHRGPRCGRGDCPEVGLRHGSTMVP